MRFRDQLGEQKGSRKKTKSEGSIVRKGLRYSSRMPPQCCPGSLNLSHILLRH